MILDFTAEEVTHTLQLRDVKTSQFFVSEDGFLLQKVKDDGLCRIIADPLGKVSTASVKVIESDYIKRIINHVTKIKF